MATSGSSNFSISREDIIGRALRMVGAISQGQTPNSTLINNSAFALNCLVKALQADGMPLWAIKTISVPLIEGVNVYPIGTGLTVDTPKPLKVIRAWNRDVATNIDIPVRILTHQEYDILGNKSTQGNPIQIYYEPLRTSGNLYVFPTPSTTEVGINSIYIVYQRPFEDFDVSTDEPDFPQEWFDAVCYGLAVRIAPEYGMPLEDRKALQQDYAMIKNEA